MQQVILDTNALLMQFQFKIDLKDELSRLLGVYELFIPTSVLDELEKMESNDARAAQKFAERCCSIHTEKRGDDAILDLAREMKAMVLTNDKILRHRLKDAGVKVIYLRQKKFLAIDIP